MPRPRKRRLPDEPELAAVLEGTATVSLRELLELIRRVNPSRLPLAPDARAARYATKARLQSLLLRRHHAELVVLPSGRPGIVALRVRNGRGDGGHVVVARLDADARELVAARLESDPA